MRKHRHCGQAIVEMCVCLIPILVIMLGMIFISGLCISNIRSFIQGKGNAEHASRQSDAVGGSSNNRFHPENIYCWEYGTYRFINSKKDDDEFVLPFATNDTPVSLPPGNNTEAYINEQLNSNIYSELSDEHMPINELTNLPYPESSYNYNFADNSPDTMLTAADLIGRDAGNKFNNVFTLDSRHSDKNDIKSWKLSFTHLFGLKVDALDLLEIRANTVYYPALPAGN